ncbi:DUF6042 family protein [Fodinicola acaciae]|uniref:DUF6042 family protein n=1 Tax=Fodinicola acaciae TaxID=2681555 RepID=UPI0013D43A47|nr:DUF6042 family protein [Fodinicola acaciae]
MTREQEEVAVSGFEAMPADTEWYDSGWSRLLPPPAESLRLLAIKAEIHDYDGGLDALVLRVGQSWFERNAYGGLDTAPRWEWGIDERTNSPEERTAWRRGVCVAALTDAGIPVPSTVRELAEVMVRLGLLTVEGRGGPDERWRTHRFLPRPDEVLTIDESWLAEDSRLRWGSALAEAIEAFWMQWDRRRSPEHWRTSINKLAKSTNLPPDSIRYALGYVCQQEWDQLRPNESGVEISTVGHDGPFDADPERIVDSKTIYIHFLPSPALQAALDNIDRLFGPKKDS